jgi:glyoxylase-like metal-dependent hydrolase (beta-lactamase superfamily II)
MRVIRVIASEIGTNSYLLLTEKPVMIDPGTLANKVLDNLKKHMEPEDLEYILLTHFHYDHTEAAPRIKEVSRAKVLAHELDAKFLDFKPDKTLEDDETLNLGNVELKVIHTPGHTPGSICLYEPTTKSLFSGDTVFPHGGVGRTDLLRGSLRDIINSLKRLCEFDIGVLYPGHGEVTHRNVNKQIKNSLESICRLKVDDIPVDRNKRL